MSTANRYSRQTQLAGFGQEAQDKLKQAKVLVIGAGGLGVPVLQYLTGMGVGTIGIMDGDTISLSNLHRQVLYTEQEVGKPKAEVAANKLNKLNAEVQLQPYPYFLSAANALEIIKDYDLVIDASDNFGTRYLVNDACVILGKPYIYGAVQQFEGHVSVFNYRGGPTYRCLYPIPPSANEIPDCNTAGVLGVTPGIIGCQQALQAIKVLTGIGETLSGYLQIFDFERDDQYKIKLKAKAENLNITTLQSTYDIPSPPAGGTMEVNELFNWYTDAKPFFLIDVRELKEFNEEHLLGSHHFPLSTLSEHLSALPANIPLITICQIGGRSAKAATVINDALPGSTVYNVVGGLETWFDEIGEQFIEYPKQNA
ncbi:HesA/MoeB/ThiF family protein [Mucilaginibacter polytrichastri]|uniref:Molybdopterin-synthase adenylyltransferase n=1 Tax=Mucilaginibacter polytrichastri TaxID=1302689 RepID=A0A1Q5ZU96_9SPHI|nr:HesA/MoeB/ThiF family protein [Mucilaginibacter polytrichastri]OKS85340.1 putative molybdopterin-synthase adenylyltransferase [Mucilaginibacter polytrichastri]SFS40498.1 adenylyltransferase and sulfurtransferase [Mucilaginibacter polytrichastri]